MKLPSLVSSSFGYLFFLMLYIVMTSGGGVPCDGTKSVLDTCPSQLDLLFGRVVFATQCIENHVYRCG